MAEHAVCSWDELQYKPDFVLLCWKSFSAIQGSSRFYNLASLASHFLLGPCILGSSHNELFSGLLSGAISLLPHQLLSFCHDSASRSYSLRKPPRPQAQVRYKGKSGVVCNLYFFFFFDWTHLHLSSVWKSAHTTADTALHPNPVPGFLWSRFWEDVT